MNTKTLTVAIDIDGTATEQPAFFALLCSLPNVRIVVLTARDEANALEFLRGYGIRWDQLIADCMGNESKGKHCRELGVDIFFEDEDERIRHVPQTTLVFKTRNGGNFCFETMKWLVNRASEVKLLCE